MVEDMLRLDKVSAIYQRFSFNRENFPLPSGEYPAFLRYQRTAVDKEAKRREAFQAQLAKFEEKKDLLNEMNKLTTEVLRMEQETRERMEALRKAEEQRRADLVFQEELIMKKRLEEEADNRSKRLDWIRNWEHQIQNMVSEHDKYRQADYDRFAQEVAERKRLDDIAMRARKEEEVLQNLEFRTSQRLLELFEFKKREEKSKLMPSALDYREKENRMKERLIEERCKREDEETRMRYDMLLKEKMASLKSEEALADHRALEYKLALEDYERETKQLELEKERKLRELAGEAVLRQKQLNTVLSQQEQIMKKEEEQIIWNNIEREKRSLQERTQEKLRALDEARQEQNNELDRYRGQLGQISGLQQRGEFEQRLREAKRQHQQKMSEKDAAIHDMMNVVQEERNIQKELKSELLMRDRNLQSSGVNGSRLSQGDTLKKDWHNESQGSQIKPRDERIPTSSDSEFQESESGDNFQPFQYGPGPQDSQGMKRYQKSISSYTYSDTVPEDMLLSRQSKDLSAVRGGYEESKNHFHKQARASLLAKVSEEDFNSREENDGGNEYGNDYQFDGMLSNSPDQRESYGGQGLLGGPRPQYGGLYSFSPE
jgi:hypothetical protein